MFSKTEKSSEEINQILKNVIEENSSLNVFFEKPNFTENDIVSAFAQYFENNLDEDLTEAIEDKARLKNVLEEIGNILEKEKMSKNAAIEMIVNLLTKNQIPQKEDEGQKIKETKKSGIVKKVKKQFKKILNASKDAVFDEVLEEFEKELDKLLKEQIEEILRTCSDILNTLADNLRAEDILQILEDFDFRNFLNIVKEKIEGLKSIKVLLSLVDVLINLKELEDLVKNICIKCSSEKNKETGDRAEGDAIDTLSGAIADYLTKQIIQLVNKLNEEKAENNDLQKEKEEMETKKEENKEKVGKNKKKSSKILKKVDLKE